MIPAPWLWIPVTVGAALAQTLRNTAQRHLMGSLGTLGATLVRFLYGLPFAALWLGAVRVAEGVPMPAPTWAFAGWVLLGAVCQIAATGLLLRVMEERNFALGVAYSKSEILQVAVFGLAFLGDRVSAPAASAIALGTLGVLLLSPADRQRPLHAVLVGWTTRPALLGLASGTGFALAAVGYRGAALALGVASFLMAAAYTLVAAQLLQTVLLGAWLILREAAVVTAVLRAWRASLFAGFMGAAASAGWFTAMAIEPAAHVRTLGLIELLFSYVISRRVFRERLTRRELAAIALLTLALVVMTRRR
ncbi:MAG TPA: EamA/RhaT family transporter [Methylomirabilota bacterium]|nr:EamA/RhaT family transporter [Methylomirabilota bacterium]